MNTFKLQPPTTSDAALKQIKSIPGVVYARESLKNRKHVLKSLVSSRERFQLYSVSTSYTADSVLVDKREETPEDNGKIYPQESDYVVIGSGIGGLCCAALLAKYGYSVTVLESHYLPGGCAHGFEIGGYSFDAGPSFFVGLTGAPGTSSNPLKQVLDVIGESVDCKQYNQWIVYSPEGTFPCVAGRDQYLDNILRQGGEEALKQWLQLEELLKPLQQAAALFPAAAVRADLGVLLTSSRFLGLELAKTGLVAGTLTGPFSAVVDKVVTNKWLRSFLDLECFVLSGMTAKDTL
ncbi:hypothetical protein CEUSTIGMA_g8397.t1 [Chlamydomonas eustigma]|uniref:Amine oxidase domain-containing protein n=1 Tax=Chlamydomonas eustigma TaxID=1157962 RepID=A0A250XDK8_9CHLO|nr:hypothetical protein CEUSTIGMA_g8397.t1 [Chlamydomonas eustigma]|eukprot:GAX80962.1 hypothetical protein CEUSTIGMA_g8397.t1 [Chlamydomonas eustigma]